MSKELKKEELDNSSKKARINLLKISKSINNLAISKNISKGLKKPIEINVKS